ncbi:MAG: hypothetical protein J6U14_02805 [Bacteroidaceae bacterium]|nr:hypothetical protein [Bacteroidaceae bacterium]
MHVVQIIRKVNVASSEVIQKHLRNGDKVHLDEFGLMKLEIQSHKVDNPADFNPKEHIRGVRLHIIPESVEGVQALYKDIQFEKDKIFVED